MEQGKIIYPFAPDLQISPLSSLNFEHDWRRDFQTPCHYEQKFVRWDRIRVQYAATVRYSFKACITDNDTGQTSVLNPTELKAFRRVTLEPGETATVVFDIPVCDCTIADADANRIVEPGEFELLIGHSSRRDDLKRTTFTVA